MTRPSTSSAVTARPPGRRGRHLGLLLVAATVAAFLLVPAAQALAAHGTATVVFGGEGEGEVSSAGGFFGTGAYEGIPAIECHGPEPGEGQCVSEMEEDAEVEAGKDGIYLHAEAAQGSEFVGWFFEAGEPGLFCAGSEEDCLPLVPNTPTVTNVKVVAVFEPASGPTTQPLALTTSGSGSGSFECEDITAAGSAAPCASGDEFPEGDEVKVIAVEGAGSDFVEFNGENGGECSGATCSVTMSGAKSVNAKFDLEPLATQPLTIEVEGEGEVTSSPAGITCTEAGNGGPGCEAEFAEGGEVELLAGAETGWQFAGWTTVTGTEEGGCEGTATPCTTGPLNEAVTLKATFTEVVLPEFPIEVTVAGEGQVTGMTIACTEAGGTCTEERKETETVTLSAAAEAGSHFVGWTGVACTGGNTSATCSFTMPGSAVNVEAEFALTTTSPLTVVLTGDGTVTSDPAGISCTSPASESCTEELEGTVELTAAPAAGYTFAGWLGCKHVAAGRCTVEVNSPTEVTAVFLEKGERGEKGEEGEEGEKGEKGDTGNPGSPGTPGSPGPAGPQGPAGPGGATGATGATGPTGAKGDTGGAGAQGPAGATGPQGPAGKNAKVTCQVKQQKGGKKVKVTCTVKYQGGGAKSSSLHWRLSRGGHTVRRGSAHGAGRLDLGHLRPGRYVLHVQGHREAIVVH